MPFLSRDTVKIYYDQWGTQGSHTLVLVNGYQRSSSDFKALGKKLNLLGYGVLVLDNRGVGQTETQNAFSLDDLADDLAAVIGHSIEGKYSILGISMGGMIAQRALVKKIVQPEKLILVSTASRTHPWKLTSNLEPFQDDSYYLGRLEQYVAPKFFKTNRLLMRGLAKQLAVLFNDRASIRMAELQSDALKNFNITQQISALTIPTLILHGDSDRVIDVQGALECHRHIAQSTLIIFPEVGHLILAEAPQLLIQELSHFLKS